jgi:hypothetical protein
MPMSDSQAIAQVEYDDASRTLFIRFTGGGWYAYLDVAPELYSRLMQAPSLGRFFQQQVRGRYRYARLELKPSPP